MRRDSQDSEASPWNERTRCHDTIDFLAFSPILTYFRMQPLPYALPGCTSEKSPLDESGMLTIPRPPLALPSFESQRMSRGINLDSVK